MASDDSLNNLYIEQALYRNGFNIVEVVSNLGAMEITFI